ncbi:MAG: hypothetical protein LHV68_06250 [Elusimicrobia bacterium]|nr:hypothetical protein [Candidatus Liberimonas magnetica]
MKAASRMPAQAAAQPKHDRQELPEHLEKAKTEARPLETPAAPHKILILTRILQQA